MTQVVRLAALEALAELIVADVPEFTDRVCVGVPPNSHEQVFPSLSIRAGGRWTFEPGAVEDLEVGLARTVVRRVGHHEGMVQLRVLAATAGERDELAQRVMDVFLAFEDEYGFPHPGTILARVTRCTLLPWTAAFDLARDEWVDSGAFTNLYEGLIETDARIPALVTKAGVTKIETLILGLTEDLNTTPAIDMLAAPTVEVVRINEDGSIDPV